ncbi:unnamed protein product [Ostreobium quekettii]|uniref:Transmembrane 9 superfamily member n=1 Tax=Ostreobium quekettii TaxID=121088 RepID=A0A8S1J500_9CHLO|nr:unnamed protein product [Ostreobium quekettii]|eukprot:evm.model.scf_30EXC.6 EVM.evm.TU.scf_30EXC.6   scf_30EXC:101550-110013(+)
MGEVMDANRLAKTNYQISFKDNKPNERLCSVELTAAELAKFRKAVKEDWYYQMYFDDLPVWGVIGKTEKVLQRPGTRNRQLLFTHMHFELKYNGEHVVEISVPPDRQDPVDISKGVLSRPHQTLHVDFTYSVHWTPTTTKFENRLQRYKRDVVNPVHLEIHWFSIVNSCVTVLLLTAFMATILMRILKNDFSKYAKDEEVGGLEEDESGWKDIHGDVFRFPPLEILFCAFVGTGTQLFFLSGSIFVLAAVGVFYPYNRGALFTALVVLYALTAGISGYVGCSYYRQMGGRHWVPCIFLMCFVFCGPLFMVFCFLNTVAIAYRSTAALPFGTIVVILVIWALITIPLTVLGGVVGKNSRSEFYAPVRTNKHPREIPVLPWFQSAPAQMVMAGFLPFSAIYVELYYVFTSIWGHRLYIIWSILSIVFVILIIVTAFVTMALTYFQLAAEDHRWWWRSFLRGGSTGAFIYAYCFYYYVWQSQMYGFMQASFFFCYMAIVAYGFFLMLGAVGWRASLMFVRHIYKSIKIE